MTFIIKCLNNLLLHYLRDKTNTDNPGYLKSNYGRSSKFNGSSDCQYVVA